MCDECHAQAAAVSLDAADLQAIHSLLDSPLAAKVQRLMDAVEAIDKASVFLALARGAAVSGSRSSVAELIDGAAESLNHSRNLVSGE